MVGVQRAKTIAGINKDPRAPIFGAADYGVVGYYTKIVPALAMALEKAQRHKS